MERFVFVAAVTIAILFGLGAMFGGNVFHFDMDESGFHEPEAVMATSAGTLEARSYEGQRLRVRYIAARVVIVPEARQDFSIEIANPGGLPMPEVTSEDGLVTIDGRLRGRVGSCVDGGAEIRGYERATLDTMPVVTIRAPRDLQLERSGAGTTEIGALQSLELDFTDCGSATIGDVASKFDIDLAGSGAVVAGAAGSLNADVAGSGSLEVGAVTGGADVNIAGSGQVTIVSLTGDLSADGAGSGNLSIQGGAITDAHIDLAGSGDVNVAAPVQSLDVSIVGSGDVAVADTVGDLEADIAGSGSVSARAVTGRVSQETWGSGEVRIGE